MISLSTLQNILLYNALHTAVFSLFWALGVIHVALMFIIMLYVFQVDDHVQGVGQDQQQDEGGDEAHQDGRCQEGGAVARRRKLPRGDIERLNLRRADTFPK